MDALVTTGTNLSITIQTTVEDIINYKKSDIQAFLKLNSIKISGNKLELAQRVVDTIQSSVKSGSSPTAHLNQSDQLDGKGCDLLNGVPSIVDLQSGWSGESDNFPKVNIKDVENYLLHSSHRTEDSNQMQCYRQYIRGLNFYKEGYIHKIMINEIDSTSKCSYVRSKCYPSMRKGVYEQWLLVTKMVPFQVLKANCTCPAGLGEGCTHVAGLLFALEGRPNKIQEDDIPCTSKPCQWNRPSKRKKVTRPVQEIAFKKIKYEDNLKVKEKKIVSYKVDSLQFRNSLCSKLGNKSRAALFYILPPCTENSINVESDLNVADFEEVETSEHIQYASDKFIDVKKAVKDENMSESDFLNFISSCNQEIVNEVEFRTRAQHSNPLWVLARSGRITASNFHDIKTKKDTSNSDNLISKILGQNCSFDNSAVAWGRKQEPIAKKRYKAYRKLKDKTNVTVLDIGLVLCTDYSYIGASPDGIVNCNSEKYLIEVKCPYRWRNSYIKEACKDKSFCCFVDENQNICLKKSHRYYTQVQGQMGVCKMDRCDFVIYTVNDFIIIPIQFDQSFWETLVEKLKDFYIREIFPKLL